MRETTKCSRSFGVCSIQKHPRHEIAASPGMTYPSVSSSNGTPPKTFSLSCIASCVVSLSRSSVPHCPMLNLLFLLDPFHAPSDLVRKIRMQRTVLVPLILLHDRLAFLKCSNHLIPSF